ncbi:PAS domain-containing protein [Mucilaginibacter corticis]|uniref:histidine kinase n=1 Tax=Mucilaginibacter corticis TaxID=2597670 RepID=A0A556MRS5_9SPHI|nr:PAS domain-containing protein [Mucilaginibacter corticis]TSJ42651.1 PAS domain-containing protein [Mucilaginibacter corticis]
MKPGDNQDLYNTVLTAPIGICILDAATLVAEMVNDKFVQVAGKPADAIVGKYYWDAFAEARQRYEAALNNVVQTGQPYHADEVELMLIRHGKPETVFVSFVYSPIKNSEGKVNKVAVWVFENTMQVNARQKTEQANKDLKASQAEILHLNNELTTKNEQLAIGQQNIRNMIRQAPVGMCLISGEPLYVEEVNDLFLEIVGKQREQFYNTPYWDVIIEAKAIYEPITSRVMQTGETYHAHEHEIMLIRNGVPEAVHVDFVYEPTRNIDNKVTGIMIVATDVTDKVLARQSLQEINDEMAATNEEIAASNEELTVTNEELSEAQKLLQTSIDRLTESEQQIRALVASAPFPIAVYIGREMRIAQANQAIIDVWGKGSKVIGRTYYDLLPELEEQDIYPLLDGVFTTGIPFHARNQRVDITIDGKLTVFYFNYSFTPLLDKTGKVYGVLNTAADVTDLNLAKQKLERNERNFRSMIIQAPVAICLLTGPQHIVELVNTAMLEIWGKPRADVVNKPVFDALPDAREQGLEEVMANVYNTGQAFTADEQPVSLVRYGVQDTVYQNFVYQPYRDLEGHILGILAISIDVTEQVMARRKIEQSETELLATKKKLEAELEAGKLLQQQKDGFIGMASHELKTPLTSLSAIVQVANLKLKNSEDPFLAGAMERANSQVKRMNNLINGFLNVSRLESGQILIDKSDFDLVTLIDEVIAEHRLTVSSHQFEFEVHEHVVMHADREKIGSVVSNLLSNAVKYSPKSEIVKVKCQIVGEDVQVSVKDGGMGIKADDLTKVFDRYYRVETNHTRHIAGFGIGLYLSAEIVRRHNGKIWVESQSGIGSVFYFSLPLAYLP